MNLIYVVTFIIYSSVYGAPETYTVSPGNVVGQGEMPEIRTKDGCEEYAKEWIKHYTRIVEDNGRAVVVYSVCRGVAANYAEVAKAARK